MDRRLAKVWEARTRGEYQEALEEVNLLLDQSPDQVPLLVMRAELIQLKDLPEGGPSLESAKHDLERAISLDESSPIALLEMGHFLFSVEDDADQASEYFLKAISLCRDLLAEALVGHAEVLHEQEKDADAFACFAEAHSLRERNQQNDEFLLERLRSVLQSR
jgi:tetratricopeptide (TPR) repeat protein